MMLLLKKLLIAFNVGEKKKMETKLCVLYVLFMFVWCNFGF